MRSLFHFAMRGPPMAESTDSAPQFRLLARNFEVLASEPRIELLHRLRTPRLIHEIRLEAPEAGLGRAGRPLSRQAISKHLRQLLSNELVHRIPRGPRARGDTYVLNHQRLFALVDEMRNLSKLQPALSDPAAVGQTVPGERAGTGKLPAPPRLLVAYGRDDGVAFGLNRPVGSRWRIGRAKDCEIRLDYDPYISSHHATLDRAGPHEFVLTDGASRNGTWINWARLPPGGSRALEPASLITVGRSVLVLQP